MVRATAPKVGEGPCPGCGARIWFRRSSGGKLTHKCDTCDSSGYAEPGGKEEARLLATFFGASDPPQPKTPTAAAASVPAPVPAPPPKRPASIFNMGDL